MNDNNGDSQVWTNSLATNVMSSPLKTPVSAKGGRTYNKSKFKEGKAGPQTPISNAG